MRGRGSAAAVSAGVAVSGLALLTLAVAVLATLGGALPGGGCGGDGGIGGGAQQIGARAWSGEQTANARVITAGAVTRRLPRRAAVLAVATAIVESGLVNVHYGDRDSQGLFQQRPSQGWGPIGDILNPGYAAGAFYAHLVAVPGWATMAPGQAEQAVQRSADPGAYGPQETPAADLVTRFWTGPDHPAPPPPPPAAAAGSQQGQAAQLASLRVGCPDQGGSTLPLGSSTLDVKALPPGVDPGTDPAQHAAVAYALAQVGKPYVWGAKGPDAFDCSGLMQAAWASAGTPISGGTTSQVHDGTPVSGLDQLAPGDLLFIPGALGTPAVPRHVGMYAGGGVVVDAYGADKGVIVEQLTAWQPVIVAIRHITGPPGPTGPATPPPAAGSARP